MPSLKHTKRRIVSVKNTQKITRAMKLVSSAKFARANNLLLKAQRSFDSFVDLVGSFLDACSQEELAQYLNMREEKKTLLVVLATDRGLCGGLNTNLFKLCQNFLREKKKSGVEVDLVLWGRKAGQYGKNAKGLIFDRAERILDKPSYAFCKEQANKFYALVKSGKYDRLTVVYPSFLNAMTQQPVAVEMLPIKNRQPVEGQVIGSRNSSVLVESSKEEIVEDLLSTYLAKRLFKILLEASLSEHASRMAAMDSATNNADKVIRNLTLDYNRARQASITKELIEITSGAEAL